MRSSLPYEVLVHSFSFVITNENSQSDCELRTNISLVSRDFYHDVNYFKSMACCLVCQNKEFIKKQYQYQCHFCDKYSCWKHTTRTCDDCNKCICRSCNTLIIGRWSEASREYHKYKKINMSCQCCSGRMCCTSAYADNSSTGHSCDHCRNELDGHLHRESTHIVHHRLISCEHQCNTIIKTEDDTYTHTCGKLCCEQCVSTCNICSKVGCNDHRVLPCNRCGMNVCSDDTCPHYNRVGKRVCNKCSDICSQCECTISESDFRYLEKFCSNGKIILNLYDERGHVYFTALYNLYVGWCDHNQVRYCTNCLEHHECSGVPKYSENCYLDFRDINNRYDCDIMWDKIGKCYLWVDTFDQGFRVGHPCACNYTIDPAFLEFWSQIGQNQWLNHVTIDSILKYMT